MTHAKTAVIERLRAAGYRVFAMVDNEPNNLKAIADAGLDDGMLLLQASHDLCTFTCLKEWGEINAEAVQKLSQPQFEFIDACLGSGVKQMTLLQESKDYKELFSRQVSLVAEYDALDMESIRKAIDVMTESKDKIISSFEKSMEMVTEPAKGASPVAKTAGTKKAA